MKLVRVSLICLVAFLSLSTNAQAIPVIVDRNILQNDSKLDDLEFQLHARSGEVLIGTMSDDVADQDIQGILQLSGFINSFDNIYQVDPHAFRNNPQLLQDIDPFYSSADLALFRGTPDFLNALASAGIPFRAISDKPLTPSFPDNGGSNLDDMDQFVGVILDQITSSSYQNYLQTLQDFGTRNSYNDRSVDVANWILTEFQSMGLDAWLDSFEIGGLTRYNVIAELTGTDHPQQMYYLTAHYDATAGLPIFPEDNTPGADDDGSGAALVLEAAKVMSQFSFQNTVRFAIFCGNEQGLVGSEAYVANLPGGEVYLGALDADMVGWSGTDSWPPDLVVYTDDNPSSILLADKISEAVDLFVEGFVEVVTVQDASMVYADHAPFWDAGIPAVLAMEDEMMGGDLSPYYHSTNDLIDYINFVYALHVTETLTATVADLAVPNGEPGAFLYANGVILDDSQGNNNGRLEYGETFSLTIPIINAGDSDAPNVSTALSESDPYLTLFDWVENYGTIMSGDTVEVVNAFSGDVTVDVPDQHQFEINMLMSSGSDFWTSLVQIVAHAPVMDLDDIVVDDSQGGNGNGQLELGESADILIELFNTGSAEALELFAQLTTNNPYVTINTGPQNIGTLGPDSMVTLSYNVSASETSPAFYFADFSVNCQATGGWTASNGFTLEVGDLTHLPTGPDVYGYSAYDPNDEPYAPAYNWIEIDPGQGGPGTEIDFNDDDETIVIDLPFTFVYYGQSYTQMSVCSNGWLACGSTDNTDYSNSSIPDEDGPSAMISPYWDDLSPQASGSVSYYYNPTSHIFIIEYYDVRDFQPSWDHMTFETILFDPAEYPTTTGDGDILFQYNSLDNFYSCTIGIENQAEDDGLQYLYNWSFDEYATTLTDNFAILFTTGAAAPPFSIDINYVSGSPVPPGGGNLIFDIFVEYSGSSPIDYEAWLDIEYEGGLPTTVVYRSFTNFQPGWTINRPGTYFPVPSGYAAGNYEFIGRVGEYPLLVWQEDGFPFVKNGNNADADFIPFIPDVPFPNPFDTISGVEDQALVSVPEKFSVGQNYPNPFNAETVIPLSLPETASLTIELYNLQGQKVASIFDGIRQAGQWKVPYDASALSSGIYFYRVQMTGTESGNNHNLIGKMVLLK